MVTTNVTTARAVAAADAAAGTAVCMTDLVHRYGTRTALDRVSLQVHVGEIFALLGPNGGGKTTLFHLLATLVPPTDGQVQVLGYTLPQQATELRPHLGVVFQHPSLDPKLTVSENLRHHGHLYGLRGAWLRQRMQDVLQRLELAERRGDLVETLSGGLQRRVELAKALLHQPRLLVLDEPSTGLDPGARREFMHHLHHLRDHDGVSVLLTTHILEEAEHCDRVGILHQGRLVALGTPHELRAQVGGDVVVIQTANPTGLQAQIQTRFGCTASVFEHSVRVEIAQGHTFVRDVVEACAADIQAVTFSKPTLEDVFVHVTGQRFWQEVV